ncbi:MAG: hypothetical protein JST66_15485 [Bacteroidetes bacterium]|nr:hypothetical protein [Bacteroidota bacterium]
MRPILLFLLAIMPSYASAQWAFVVSSSEELLMTALGKGFRSEFLPGISPSQGDAYRIIYTPDEWTTELGVYYANGYGPVPQCCYVSGFERISDSSLFFFHHLDSPPFGVFHALSIPGGVHAMPNDWQQLVEPYAPVNDTLCYFVSFRSPDTLLVLSSRSTDHGIRGKVAGKGPGPFGMDFLNVTNGMIAMTDSTGMGTIHRTTDEGESWSMLYQRPTSVFTDIRYVSEQDIWIAGQSGLVLRSTDGGMSWLEASAPTTADLLSIDAYSADQAWVSGDNGLILSTTDGGMTWMDRSIPNAGLVGRVQALNQVVYAYVKRPPSANELYRYTGPGAYIPEHSGQEAPWWGQDADGFYLLAPEPIQRFDVLDTLGRIVATRGSDRHLRMTDRSPGAYVLRVRTADRERRAKVAWPGAGR